MSKSTSLNGESGPLLVCRKMPMESNGFEKPERIRDQNFRNPSPPGQSGTNSPRNKETATSSTSGQRQFNSSPWYHVVDHSSSGELSSSEPLPPLTLNKFENRFALMVLSSESLVLGPEGHGFSKFMAANRYKALHCWQKEIRQSDSDASKSELPAETKPAKPIKIENDQYEDVHYSLRCKRFLRGKECDGSCSKVHKFPKEDGVKCAVELRGQCHLGNNCIFLHENPDSDSDDEGPSVSALNGIGVVLKSMKKKTYNVNAFSSSLQSQKILSTPDCRPLDKTSCNALLTTSSLSQSSPYQSADSSPLTASSSSLSPSGKKTDSHSSKRTSSDFQFPLSSKNSVRSPPIASPAHSSKNSDWSTPTTVSPVKSSKNSDHSTHTTISPVKSSKNRNNSKTTALSPVQYNNENDHSKPTSSSDRSTSNSGCTAKNSPIACRVSEVQNSSPHLLKPSSDRKQPQSVSVKREIEHESEVVVSKKNKLSPLPLSETVTIKTEKGECEIAPSPVASKAAYGSTTVKEEPRDRALFCEEELMEDSVFTPVNAVVKKESSSQSNQASDPVKKESSSQSNQASDPVKKESSTPQNNHGFDRVKSPSEVSIKVPESYSSCSEELLAEVSDSFVRILKDIGQWSTLGLSSSDSYSALAEYLSCHKMPLLSETHHSKAIVWDVHIRLAFVILQGDDPRNYLKNIEAHLASEPLNAYLARVCQTFQLAQQCVVTASSGGL